MLRQISFESASNAVAYDPETGLFTRVGFSPDEKRNTRPDVIGAPAGHTLKSGYVNISIANKTYFAHRLAFLLMTGKMPPSGVDHIDGNPSNNKWDNLRLCNQSQNLANRGANRTSRTGVKGATWCASTSKWRVKIMVNYKTIHVGRFKTLEEAAKAYATACKFHFGEFGRAE